MSQSDPALVLNLFDREAIRDLIQETAALLDNENFDGWLELFAVQSVYEITAYSPEIKDSMSWWNSSLLQRRDWSTGLGDWYDGGLMTQAATAITPQALPD